VGGDDFKGINGTDGRMEAFAEQGSWIHDVDEVSRGCVINPAL
jgi:hypothetical protein